MKKNEGTTGIKMNVATSYTSLRDVMVSLPHSSSSSSSSSSLNTSWDEHNSIKNHLLKQAALAYLMSTSTDQDLDNNNNNNGCFNNLKCFSCGGSSGESGCFQWLSFGTLIEAIVGFFCGKPHFFHGSYLCFTKPQFIKDLACVSQSHNKKIVAQLSNDYFSANRQ
ncbi:hypothetical protein P8452_05466 [Trifolium repens]|nr:hypothetical protein P8452_05466 [Trifolium repens]